jgi:hypothetical protein
MAAGAGPWRLLGADGKSYDSATPGKLGAHRRNRIYGRLDCPSALRAIQRGGYVRHRVFFAGEPTAIAAGYRPCARCMPEQYAAWKRSGTGTALPAPLFAWCAMILGHASGGGGS